MTNPDSKREVGKFNTDGHEIKKINPNDYSWNCNGGNGKYSRIWQTIREMPIGAAVEVKINEPNKYFSTAAYQTFRKANTGGKFRVLVKHLPSGGFQNYAILKIKGNSDI